MDRPFRRELSDLMAESTAPKSQREEKIETGPVCVWGEGGHSDLMVTRKCHSKL